MDDNRLYEEESPGQFSLCAQVRDKLGDLLEGYLDAVTAEAIRAHLSVCYMCARTYDEMERTVRLVETLPFAEPARGIAPAVLASLRARPEYCFQAPVVEVETSQQMRIPAPRTITGQERQVRSRSGWVLIRALLGTAVLGQRGRLSAACAC